MISTYHHSWFLKTDGLGNVLVSDAIGADAQGDADHVSVTEVCSVDFSFLVCGRGLTDICVVRSPGSGDSMCI